MTGPPGRRYSADWLSKAQAAAIPSQQPDRQRAELEVFSIATPAHADTLSSAWWPPGAVWYRASSGNSDKARRDAAGPAGHETDALRSASGVAGGRSRRCCPPARSKQCSGASISTKELTVLWRICTGAAARLFAALVTGGRVWAPPCLSRHIRRPHRPYFCVSSARIARVCAAICILGPWLG